MLTYEIQRYKPFDEPGHQTQVNVAAKDEDGMIVRIVGPFSKWNQAEQWIETTIYGEYLEKVRLMNEGEIPLTDYGVELAAEFIANGDRVGLIEFAENIEMCVAADARLLADLP